MDFEHPTCKGISSNILSTSNTFALTGRQCYGNPLPKALPWTMEYIGLAARSITYYLLLTYTYLSLIYLCLNVRKIIYNTCIYQFKCRILHLIYHKIRILFTHLHTKAKAYVTYCHTSQRKIE